MTESNLPFVVSIAKRYDGKSVRLADLVQEGNLGLSKAVDRYDWRKGFKFSSYATWWANLRSCVADVRDRGTLVDEGSG